MPAHDEGRMACLSSARYRDISFAEHERIENTITVPRRIMAFAISLFQKESKSVRLLLTSADPDRIYPEQLPFYWLYHVECPHSVCSEATQKMDDHLWIFIDLAFSRAADVNVSTALTDV